MQAIICCAWRWFACRLIVVIICHSHYLAALAPLGLGALVSQCHFHPVNSRVKSHVRSRKYPLDALIYIAIAVSTMPSIFVFVLVMSIFHLPHNKHEDLTPGFSQNPPGGLLGLKSGPSAAISTA